MIWKCVDAFKFPLLSHKSVMVQQWEFLRLRIHQLLHGHDWYTLSVYGSHDNAELPVILIYAWDRTQDKWQRRNESSLVRKIEIYCRTNNVPAAVHVA